MCACGSPGGNSFTHKRTGAYRVFTAEPSNVTNIHAGKFSGLAVSQHLFWATHLGQAPRPRNCTAGGLSRHQPIS